MQPMLTKAPRHLLGKVRQRGLQLHRVARVFVERMLVAH